MIFVPLKKVWTHRVFRQFEYGGSILSSSQFLLLPQMPHNLTLNRKAVKNGSKINFLLHWSKSVKKYVHKGTLRHSVSTFCCMQFQFWIGKFLIKTQCIAVRFYLGYWNQPWFGQAGSENACIFRMRKWHVVTQLKNKFRTSSPNNIFTYGCWVKR